MPDMSTATLADAPADTAPAAPATDPSKAIMQEILNEAPDGMELYALARHLELIAGFRISQAQAARGETMTLEELKRDMATWFTK